MEPGVGIRMSSLVSWKIDVCRRVPPWSNGVSYDGLTHFGYFYAHLQRVLEESDDLIQHIDQD